MKRKITLFLLASIVLAAGIAQADGIQTLIKVGNSQAEMERSLKEEESAYRSVKEAVEDGRIKPGAADEEVSSEYGEPSVKIPLDDGSVKWVYKSSSASYFEGEKIYLFFDASGVCTGVKTVLADK